MTIDNLIDAIASIEAPAISRYQTMTSSDVASLDIGRPDLDGNKRDEDHYGRIRPPRAPQTLADSFAPLLNC